MAYLPLSDLAFSQVREDPIIELSLIKQLAEKQNHPLRILIIASGGCTVLSLLENPNIEVIDAVDSNRSQLHLVELRRQALVNLPLNEQLLLVGACTYQDTQKGIANKLENNLENNTGLTQNVPNVGANGRSPSRYHRGYKVSLRKSYNRLAIYQKIRPYLPADTQSYWDSKQEEIAFGVNGVGRFEVLFRELAAEFANLGVYPLHMGAIATSHPQWNQIFEKVFERDKLIRFFGEEAVNYSMDRSFGKHFADVFASSLQRFTPENNYFLTQVWADSYSNGIEGMPIYLQPASQGVIRSLGVDRLKLHHGIFTEKMVEMGTKQPYDLIQFSNISDWMPIPNLHGMLANAVEYLRPGGILIGRRLNGDHILADIMAKHLPIDKNQSSLFQENDRSFFYQEVVVGVKEY
jgi:S-adenosylmethionine-diacylglycerol 3-amino-3-carboxypropyl transferase